MMTNFKASFFGSNNAKRWCSLFIFLYHYFPVFHVKAVLSEKLATNFTFYFCVTFRLLSVHSNPVALHRWSMTAGGEESWQDSFKLRFYCITLLPKIKTTILVRDNFVFNYTSFHHPLFHPNSYFCCGHCCCCGSVVDPWTIIHWVFLSLQTSMKPSVIAVCLSQSECYNDWLLCLVHHLPCDRIICGFYSSLPLLWILQFIIVCLPHFQER